MNSAIAVRGEAAEVASAEARAVLSMVQDEERRGKLADLVAALGEGEVDGDDAQALEELLELGLQTGRVRALYGPEGETAALTALEGRTIEKVSVAASGPAAHLVTVSAEGLELSIRLDRQGARLTTVAL